MAGDVITLDITKGKDQDVHGPRLWGFLTELARKGAIKCVGGRTALSHCFSYEVQETRTEATT